MDEKQGEKLVGVQALAKRYGPPESWWYQKAEAGEVPSFKLGKYRKFRVSEIEAWLETQRHGPTAK